MEKETVLTTPESAVSHHDQEVAELRTDRALAVVPQGRDDRARCSGGSRGRSSRAADGGGLGQVAGEAGISREALYRALSPKGNPTLKTLLAVLKTVGMRLSVEAERSAAA